jgi:hypothetical protein
MMWLAQWRYADGDVKKGKIQNIKTTVQIPECAKCQIEAAILFLSNNKKVILQKIHTIKIARSKNK